MNTSITSIPYVQESLKSSRASGHQAPSADDFAFLAGTVMERIRRGESFLPDEQAADDLNRLPFIDYLRKEVLESDLPCIQGAISEQKPELAGLMLSLLRKFDATPAVQAFLTEKWLTASPFLKAHLMWRLLDADNMTDDRKREILDFVLTNGSVFNSVSAKFLGNPDTIVSATRNRLANPEFPVSKHWGYLCRVVEPAANKSDAKTLLTEHLNSPDEFTRGVARTLLDRFFPEASARK